MSSQRPLNLRRLRRLLPAALLGPALFLPVSASGQGAGTAPPPKESPAESQYPPEVKALFYEAVEALRKRDVAGTLAKLAAATQKAHDLGDRASEADLFLQSGNVLYRYGQNAPAKASFERALPLLRAAGNRHGEAVALGNIGNVLSDTGQNEKSLELYAASLALYRDTGDKRSEAGILGNMAGVYADLGQPARARDTFHQALALAREQKDERGEARLLNGLGLAYADLGDPESALEQYRQALPMYEKRGDTHGEASVSGNIGSALLNTGRFQEALGYFLKAAPLFQKTGDVQAGAAALTSIGLVYVATGRPREAVDYLERTLAVYRQTGNKQYEAGALMGMGAALLRTGERRRALECYRQAAALSRETKDKQSEAGALAGVGTVYAEGGDSRSALSSFRQALALARQAGERGLQAKSLRGVAQAQAVLGQKAAALAACREALALQRAVGDRQGEADALATLGTVHARAGRTAESEDAFRQAIARYEQVRSGVSSSADARSEYLASVADAYERLTASLLARGQTAEAFATVQRMKARGLLDLMAGGRVWLDARLTPEERQKERDLRAACDRLSAALVATAVKNEGGSRARSRDLQAQLSRAERELAAFGDALAARHPDLAARRIARTDTLADVAKWLPADAALVEFAVLHVDAPGDARPNPSGAAVYAFVVSRGASGTPAVSAARVGEPPSVLSERVSDLRSAFAGSGNAPYQVKAAELYRLLLSPAEKRLAGRKRLVVCPDGPLWSAPFAVLADAGGRTLLSRFEVAYAYSATGAHAAWMVASSAAAKGARTPRVLAVANPAFGGEDRLAGPVSLLASAARPISAPDRPISAPDRAAGGAAPGASLVRGGRIEPLEGTQKEADALGRRFGAAATLLTGAGAQEAALKKELGAGSGGGYRYLHVATHGFLNGGAPLQSCLVLAQPPKEGPGSEEDGFLTAREVFDLNLAGLDMAVLSACETGGGQVRAGEGLVGMTWALFAAGCPTQVLSQWPVNDASTATLMAAFYEKLRAGKGKAAALREAALTLARDPATAHPHYWAPFILVGDGR